MNLYTMCTQYAFLVLKFLDMIYIQKIYINYNDIVRFMLKGLLCFFMFFVDFCFLPLVRIEDFGHPSLVKKKSHQGRASRFEKPDVILKDIHVAGKINGWKQQEHRDGWKVI